MGHDFYHRHFEVHTCTTLFTRTLPTSLNKQPQFTCMNWKEASKSSTGYILTRKNFMPIMRLMMLWTTKGLCSFCLSSFSSVMNFFLTAWNLSTHIVITDTLHWNKIIRTVFIWGAWKCKSRTESLLWLCQDPNDLCIEISNDVHIASIGTTISDDESITYLIFILWIM